MPVNGRELMAYGIEIQQQCFLADTFQGWNILYIGGFAGIGLGGKNQQWLVQLNFTRP